MRLKFLLFYYFLLFVISISAQDFGKDYKIIPVNKSVREIYDSPCDSPLENYIARIHAWIDGVQCDTIRSERNKAKGRRPGKPYPTEAAEWTLNCEIPQVIIYKDSIGLVFKKDNSCDCHAVGIVHRENGKWLYVGETYCFKKNISDINQWIENKTVIELSRLRKYEQLKIVSTDTLAFVKYLNVNACEPTSYLLDKLKKYPLVIYGEFHFRKNSWELLQQLIKSPEFAATTGTVFLELSKDAQPELDEFFNRKTKNPDIILDIFRKEEIAGWNDKGMFDFLNELWEVNRLLKNKIHVVAADHSTVFYQYITSKEQYDSIEETPCDRNEIMAEIIEKSISNSPDKRNHLFIVGWGHAYKSTALQIGYWQTNGLSAGYILSEKLGRENVFSIFPHTVISTNEGDIFGKLRNGLFDWVFEKYGNKPVAFDLNNSPFGNELFDADNMMRVDVKTGSFFDNFDGYIFLQSVHEEEQNTPLYELYTDDYIDEIKRRARITDPRNDSFWNIKLENLNRNTLFDKLNKEKGQKRWRDL
ncbi:MAG: hypothetical protein LBH32_14310 [Dysgonamonadaceae bacterium]|jgi:hypothetical protein|nr:hypothetical protein [Dysgonamonadaceae bacterium]